MSIRDLFLPKYKNSDPEVRKSAIEKITDKVILYEIAQNDYNVDVRIEALKKIEDQSVLAQFAQSAEDKNIRLNVVRRLKDQKLLAIIAEKDSNSEVRLEAINKIEDQSLLAQFAQSAEDKNIRLNVVRRLKDQKLLAIIAEKDSNSEVRLEAINKIEDQSLLAQFAQSAEDKNIRLNVVKKLKDQKLLAIIAEKDSNSEVRLEAINKIEDQSVVARIGQRDEVKKLESTLFKSAYSGDKYDLMVALVKLNIEESLEPLVRAIKEGNHHMRCWAATSIGDLAVNLNNKEIDEKVKNILMQTMKHDSYFGARRICAEQLSRLNCIDAIDPITKLIEEKFEYGMIPKDHELSHLESGWETEHYAMRSAAINALKEIGLNNKELTDKIKYILENLKISEIDKYNLKNHLNKAIRKLDELSKPQRIYEYAIDPRDDKKYKIVKIGNQVWMAQNLAYKEHNDGWPYNDEEENVEKYGYLYDWESAMKLCPKGWHLPSDEEWKELEIHLGMSSSDADIKNDYKNDVKRGSNEGSKLKSTEVWYEGENGTDESGFSALPSGNKEPYYESRGSIQKCARFWSSTEEGGEIWIRELRNYKDTISRELVYKKNYCSIRCVKD